eukprot:8351105-Pyramimonas_sp.AAC.3
MHLSVLPRAGVPGAVEGGAGGVAERPSGPGGEIPTGRHRGDRAGGPLCAGKSTARLLSPCLDLFPSEKVALPPYFYQTPVQVASAAFPSELERG